MTMYDYRAMNAQGVISGGLMEAASEPILESKITGLGYTLIEVSEKKELKSFSFGTSKVSRKEVRNLTVYLHTTLTAGIPLVAAVEGYVGQLTDGPLKTVLKGLVLNIQDGDGFAEALGKYPKVFPNLYVNLIGAGEASGQLEETLANLVSYLEDQEKIIADTKQATVYPIVILSLVVLLIIFILSFVLPRFMPLFESSGIELPGSAKFLMRVSDLFQNGWPYIIGGIVFFIVLIKFLLGLEKIAPILDRWKLKCPLFGPLIMKISMSQFSYNLATLMNSGVEIDRAFSLAKNVVGNRHITRAIHQAQNDINGGTSISVAMKRGQLFPPLVLQMLAVGEETGSMPYTLTKVKEYYDREVTASIKRTFSILEPAIILILGIVVGGIAVTIFTTLYSVILEVGNG